MSYGTMWTRGARERGSGLLRGLRAALASLIIACSLPVAIAGAQDSTVRVPAGAVLISGIVRDSTGAPIQGAEIRVSDPPQGTTTSSDASGAYVLRAVSSGRLRVMVRRVGFQTAVVDLAVQAGSRADVNFTLRRIPYELPSITIRDSALIPSKYRFTTRYDPFFLHRATAVSGVFLDRDEMDRRGGVAHALSSFGGVKATENMGALAVKLPRCGSGSPALIVNGVLTNGSALSMIPVSSIELIEVYRSVAEMPVEARGSGCGAIVLYTR